MSRHEEQISKHFKRYEVECHGESCCGNSAPVSDVLMSGADKFRDSVGQSVSPSNAFRCLVHNNDIGSDDTSKHPMGKAIDFTLLSGGWTVEQMRDAALEIPEFEHGGIGMYDWGIHCDVYIRELGLYLWDDRNGWSNR